MNNILQTMADMIASTDGPVEKLITHKCSKCGEQVVLECFEYDDCDNYKKSKKIFPFYPVSNNQSKP